MWNREARRIARTWRGWSEIGKLREDHQRLVSAFVYRRTISEATYRAENERLEAEIAARVDELPRLQNEDLDMDRRRHLATTVNDATDTGVERRRP